MSTERDALAQIIIEAGTWLGYSRRLHVRRTEDGSVSAPDPRLVEAFNAQVVLLIRALTIGELTLGHGALEEMISALSTATSQVGTAIEAAIAANGTSAEHFAVVAGELEKAWSAGKNATIALEEAAISHVTVSGSR